MCFTYIAVITMFIYQWDSSKLAQTRGHWDSASNQRSFLDELAKKLNILDQAGWYNVSRGIISDHGGAGLITKYGGSVKKLLMHVYPEYPKSCTSLSSYAHIIGMSPCFEV